MRTLVALCLLALAVPAVAGDYTQTQEFTYPLASGGRVYLRNEVGEVHVKATDRKDVHILVIKKARESDVHSGPSRVAELHVDVSPSAAEIRIRGSWPDRDVVHMMRGKSRLQIDYELEIPRDARLQIDNEIGEVHITGAGNDVVVHNRIGEAYVNLASSFQPHRVYLHTRIGEVQSGYPGRTTGFLGKKFTTILDGTHTLDVRVGIGEIRISGGKLNRITEL